MAGMRTYADACKTAHALDLVGERWALLVVRELLLGPKRFTDLRAGLPGASPDVLAQRLRELEGAGVVRRRKLDPPAGTKVYELTDWGRELESVVIALGQWGARSPLAPPDLETSPDAYAIALKSDFDPDAAGDLAASYEVRIGETSYRVEVAEGRVDVSRGSVKEPDAVIEAEPAAMAAVLWEGRSLADAIRSGEISLKGGRAVARRFFSLFPPPALAELGAQS